MKLFLVSCMSIAICILITCMIILAYMLGASETNTSVTSEITHECYEPEIIYEEPQVIVEREIIVIEEKANEVSESEEPSEEVSISNNSNSLYPNLNTNNSNSGSGGFRSTLECEVCEKSGTELEVWYDVNNIKHYTCKDKCTGGLDALYGR